jgi:hypothetical protein
MFGKFMEYRFDIDKVRTTILAIDPFEFPEKLPELIELIDYYSIFLPRLITRLWKFPNDWEPSNILIIPSGLL